MNKFIEVKFSVECMVWLWYCLLQPWLPVKLLIRYVKKNQNSRLVKLSDEFVTWVKNPIKPREIAGMPKPMHSNIFAAVETFKCPLDNSLSDSDPNTMLISNETKWGRALYKPFCFDRIITKITHLFKQWKVRTHTS